MLYKHMERAVFLERPNRFIAYVETARGREICHVKNTGRCRELLLPGATVYVDRNEDPGRKTPLDLIAVVKENTLESDGKRRLINMDSQAPNQVVKEALEAGRILSEVRTVRPETIYGDSRFDFYVETEREKAYIEVKGVTLEKHGYVCFPDAPTERGVKHLRELIECRKAGFGAYLIFVVQMKDVDGVMPNDAAHPEFGEVLREAMEAGVKVLAYDCEVKTDALVLGDPLPVYPDESAYRLLAIREPLIDWFKEHARVLPWRERELSDGSRFKPGPYEVWVSEIMLQQTRVEAVKGYYARFMQRLPDIQHLAEVSEDELLKLWEGLGYYNRVRNMQKAARIIMNEYDGKFPEEARKIEMLPGIGSYTAGAIASNAYESREPAVDGNVLRVIARLLAMREDISRPQVKKQVEKQIKAILPAEHPGLFNQALMEIGACVCVPNGPAKCTECPLAAQCRAREEDLVEELPVKAPKKGRRIEKRTILLVQNGREVLVEKRPAKGLLSGLYEFVNLEGHLTGKQAAEAVENYGFEPLYVEKLEPARHIFSHVEWHMIGYAVRIAEPGADRANFPGKKKNAVLADIATVQERYAIPSAFKAYAKQLTIRQGKDLL